MSYDDLYSTCDRYFGSEPNTLLVDHYRQLDRARPVLDVGAGQGRNAVFLARQGFVIDAVEPSRVAVEALRAVAGKENLPLTPYQVTFEEFTAGPQSYSGLLLFGLIQELQWPSIHLLIERARLWLIAGGLILVSAHTTEDPAYARISQGRSIGKNSFSIPDGGVRTYLEPNEIITLFDTFGVVHHWEGMGPLHRHGEGAAERHGSVEAVFRKI
jgi:2-polyprenyl-3-methyl-5-hydroxy-6-metoxy-1,4-benzoquinol methylase